MGLSTHVPERSRGNEMKVLLKFTEIFGLTSVELARTYCNSN